MGYIRFLILFAGLLYKSDAAFGPKRLYSMDLPTTAVSVKVIGKDLLIVGPWYIGSVTNVHWKFRQPSRMTPRLINKDIPNPRSVGRIPSNAFSGSKALTYWVATWGANDTNGAMYVLRPTTTYSVWKDISIDNGWNYERAQWVDMNRDGRIDCLTARFRGGVGQLLWFQQPKGQDKWGQQIIHEGMADGNFVGFVKGGKTYILVAGLQFSALGLYWTMSRTNLWSNSRMVRHRVIDNYGKFYDVQYVDLNRDGRPDVLTTTVNVGNSRGHVLGYEVPNDIQNKIWKRRVLAAGFQGDYSPGRATAFWPNKWKRKSDRPSIFLSGAGQEVLFILTPKPAKTGWSYVKSSLRAGTGLIGIPFIGDIDGDSYPEVFVPQAQKLHVFSYDYNAAVAEPPNTRSPVGKVNPRPVVQYRPAFYRPGMTPVRRNATALSAGGLTGNAASQFGSSGILPSGNAATQTVAPLANNLPPFVPRGGNTGNSVPRRPQGSSSNNAGSPPRRPSTNFGSSAPGAGAGAGAGASAGADVGAGAGAGTGVGGSSTENAGSSGQANNGDDIVLRRMMTNNGPVYIQVPNEPPPETGQNNPQFQPPPQTGQTSQGNSQNIIPWSGGADASAGQSPAQPNPPTNNRFSPNSPIVPIGGQGIVPLGGGNSDSGNGGGRITSNSIVPIGGDSNGFTPSRSPLVPVFEDETETPPYVDDYYYNYPDDYVDTSEMYSEVETPMNFVLSLTTDLFRYQEEAADACKFENKVLCSLMQLESAKSAGPLPLVEWGWFDMPGRAAEIKDCVPGEVKWRGYKCHNGIIGHAPVQQTASLKGYCCSVMRGANVTDRRYSNYRQAERGCLEIGQHICSLDEMYQVWEKSSYKSDVWGWFKNDKKLIKMVYGCNPAQKLWPGYECLGRKLITSEITANYVQESAYCCQNSSTNPFAQLKIILLLFSILLSFLLTF